MPIGERPWSTLAFVTANATADLAQARRIAAGDEAAFIALLEAVGPTLKRLTRTLVRDATTGEDVLQETWAAILDGVGSFEGRSALKTWACRILINIAKKRTAREARSVPMSALGDGEEATVDPARFSPDGYWVAPPTPLGEGRTPEGLAVHKEVRQLIQRALEDLPENQRVVVTLRDVEGWDSEEVCNALELSETNQRVLLHRGRARIRAALEGYLGTGTP
jgi:RNA polymerase sigma-70 factor (ECF subfamily)